MSTGLAWQVGLEGGPSCGPCYGYGPDASVWVTPGLSFNDPLSCLWECDRGVSSGASCAPLDRARPQNEAGSYGADPLGQTACGLGRTSEAGAALVAEDCVACPDLPPLVGAWTVFGGATSSACEWHCTAGDQRGPACVPPLPCDVEGRIEWDGGGCMTAPYPWQPAGYARVGVVGSAWSPPVVGSAWSPAVPSTPAPAAMRRRLLGARSLLASYETLAVSAPFPAIGELAGTALDPISGLVALTQQWGVSGRAWLVMTTARRWIQAPSGGAWLATTAPLWIQAPAALCSVTTATIGAQWYALGAVCNRSLLVWVELPLVTDGLQAAAGATPAAPAAVNGSGVLIGRVEPGWADGFRTQARFGSELYVAFSRGTGTLFVLDRWNCLLREVHIPWVGAYTTRAYTVYGLTAKFLIAGDPQPRCYGPGSLSNPRGFYLVEGGEGDAWLFADDEGIRQLTPARREVRLAVPASAFPAGQTPAGVTWAGAPDPFTVRVAWGEGVGRQYAAEGARCPSGWTSLAGGACTQACPWATTGGAYNYVDAAGACARCLEQGALACGLGERFVLCTEAAPSRCEPCPALPAGATYTTPGSCAATGRRPPCAAGAYLAPGGLYCQACPPYTATRLGGAVRGEQCKCYEGFRRGADGACRSRTLYTYPPSGLCAADGACVVPHNGTLVDPASCAWACAVGAYRVTGAGFWDSCQPCRGLPAGRRFTTAGDDDAPLSCEFA